MDAPVHGENPDIERQKRNRRRTLAIVSVNVLLVIGVLSYLVWEWYTDPSGAWQHRASTLVSALVFFWLISRLIDKAFAE